MQAMQGHETSPGVAEGAQPPRRYLREPVPIHFPASEQVPETGLHLALKTALFAILKAEFAGRATIGCDQFVYWNPTDPHRCLAPDVFVRLGPPHHLIRTWKVWERGAPHVAVEIISADDARDRDWQAKLARYHQAGVGELVRFDPEAKESTLRVWNLTDSDFIERKLEVPAVAECGALGFFWVVVNDPALGPMLRPSRDREGTDLLPTPEESATMARKGEAEAREALARTREAADERVRALEAEIERLKNR